MTINLASLPIEKDIKQIQICDYDNYPEFKTLETEHVTVNMFTERSNIFNIVFCEIEFEVTIETPLTNLLSSTVVIKIQDKVFGYPRVRDPLWLYVKMLTNDNILLASHKFEVSRTRINDLK